MLSKCENCSPINFPKPSFLSKNRLRKRKHSADSIRVESLTHFKTCVRDVLLVSLFLTSSMYGPISGHQTL